MNIDRLITQFFLLNISFAYLGYLAWENGLIQSVFRDDVTYITQAILVVFGYGFAMVVYRIERCDMTLNILNLCPDTEFTGNKDLFASRVRPIEYCAYLLPLIGFLGTVWGFRIALSGVSPEAAADVNSIAPMVTSLIAGMKVALSTTIAGVCGYVVLGLNVRLLEGGYDRLLNK